MWLLGKESRFRPIHQSPPNAASVHCCLHLPPAFRLIGIPIDNQPKRRYPILMEKKYIPRSIEPTIQTLREGFPCIAVTGPRQSGKTTLVRHLFPEKSYVSLEDPDEQDFARQDPRGFLDRFPDGAVFDEAQRVPSLFSYLQGRIDDDGRMGLFILTGSQHFHLSEAITQSLAGRTAMVTLAPFSFEELKGASRLAEDPDRALIFGGYPPIHTRKVSPASWLASYIATYVERDVRSLVNVRDLSAFRQFLRLCAGRVGQLVNFSSLSAECGIVHNTAKAWLSVLEAGSILFPIRPYFKNFNKRIVQTPKLYFYDTGLLCYLLGIEMEEHLRLHPQRGSIFENAVACELLKEQLNKGRTPELYFWRDRSGFEIDFLLPKGPVLDAVEVKSGKTVTGEFFRSLERWRDIAGNSAGNTCLIYGGEEEYRRNGHCVLPWKNAAKV